MQRMSVHKWVAWMQIEKEWKSTMKILLGAEPGDISAHSQWLLEGKQAMGKGRSCVSGNEVALASPDYAQGCRFAALGEAAPLKLDINGIKDLDSIVQKMGEQAAYTGNIVLGNSGFVEGSSSVDDSFSVLNSSRITTSKNVGYCTIAKECENIFGCNVTSFLKYSARCHQVGKGVRNLETWLSWLSSDCYYSFNLNGCADCMFSFNLRMKRNAIGNLELGRERYMELKKNLLAQMAEELAKKKKLPTLDGIMNACPKPDGAHRAFSRADSEPFDMKRVEKAFSDTTSLVFGKPLNGLENHAQWLKSRVIAVDGAQSALGSGSITVPGYANFRALRRDRFVGLYEGMKIGENARLSEKEASELDFSNAPSLLSKIAYPSTQFRDGPIANVGGSPIVVSSTNCHSVLGCLNLKDSAYCVWPNGSDHVFGSAFLMNSSFCIKCYSSFSLKGCFEVDSSSGCSYSYFCHNVENVHHSMFCFNAKNLNYAIGNVEVGREKYMEMKPLLLAPIVKALEAGKNPAIDIFTLCGGKKC
jgi:hypothetical protein